MAGISVSSAMLEPQTLDILLRILAFVCWSLNYINTMRTTIKSQVPSISFISICCDVGWEIVYAFIYPLASSHWAGGIRVWLMLHSVMMLTVMKYAPNEWGHVPFMKRYVSVAYVLVTTGFMAGQMALAAEIGPELGFHWGGALCQFMASFAGICHLVTRGSTRGISLKTWSFRATATAGGFTKLTIRYIYHLGDEPWLESPMCWFYIGCTLTMDAIYPILYYLVSCDERRKAEIEKEKSK